MLKTVLFSLSSILMLTGCANINSYFESLYKSPDSEGNTVSGVYEQNISNVISKLQSKRANINMGDAHDTIQKTLSILACATNDNEKYYASHVLRYSIDNSSTDSIFVYMPQKKIKYYTDGCLVIDKINGYKHIDFNNFSFNTVYLSNQTGETAQIRYQMHKQTEGRWLFKF